MGLLCGFIEREHPQTGEHHSDQRERKRNVGGGSALCP
jgi:hypothetical protein